MDGRERLTRALKAEETDRLPYAPLLTPYYFESIRGSGLDNIIDTSDYIGCEVMKRHCPCLRTENTAAECKTVVENGITTSEIRTRSGAVTQKSYRKDGTTHFVKRYISTVDDVHVMTEFYRGIRYYPDYEKFEAEERAIGHRGIATADGPMSPLLYTIQLLSTLEELTFLLFDEREAVEELFDTMHRANLAAYELISSMRLNCVIAYEDTSTTLVSREWMRGFAVPALNDYAAIMKNSADPYIVHMCGKLRGFTEEIRGIACDGIDSVCPPSTGDTTAWQARNDFEKIIIIGGIDPVFWKTAAPNEIEAKILEITGELKDKRGYILCSGDSVAAGTPLANLKAAADFIKSRGKTLLI